MLIKEVSSNSYILTIAIADMANWAGVTSDWLEQQLRNSNIHYGEFIHDTESMEGRRRVLDPESVTHYIPRGGIEVDASGSLAVVRLSVLKPLVLGNLRLTGNGLGNESPAAYRLVPHLVSGSCLSETRNYVGNYYARLKADVSFDEMNNLVIAGFDFTPQEYTPIAICMDNNNEPEVPCVWLEILTNVKDYSDANIRITQDKSVLEGGQITRYQTAIYHQKGSLLLYNHIKDCNYGIGEADVAATYPEVLLEAILDLPGIANILTPAYRKLTAK